jgi:hypothetical protein
VVFLHVFLAFPSGRLERSFDRALVAAAYATVLGLDLAVMTLADLRPHNLLRVATEPGRADRRRDRAE